VECAKHVVAIGHVEFVTTERENFELALGHGALVRLERPITAGRDDAAQHVDEVDADLAGRAGH
jgi:hypothetical protein